MALKRRKILKQALDLGYGTSTIPADSGGTLTGDKIGLHTLLGDVYNVLDFGATGNGSTDDTSAIQTAISAAASAKKQVLFPPATSYVISSQITVPTGVSLVGFSRSASIIKAKSTFTATSAFLLNSNCRIAHLGIQGRNSAFSTTAGLAVLGNTGASRITIEDCEIYEWDNSAIDIGDTVTDSIIRHNWLHHNLNEGVFVPVNAANTLIEGNVINNNGFNGVDVNGQRCRIIGNSIHDNGGSAAGSPAFPTDRNGIFIYPFSGDAWDHVVTGNTVYANAASGIYVSIGFTATSQRFSLIANNAVFANGTTGTGDGITLNGDTGGDTLADIRVTGNVIRSNQGYGINITAANAVRTWLIDNYMVGNITGDIHDLGTTTCYVNNTTDTDRINRISEGIVVGNFAPTKISQIFEASASLTPSAVSANSSSFQTVTVTGVALATDYVTFPRGVASVAGLPLVRAMVNGNNSIELCWINTTGGSLTPTAGTYKFIVHRIV